MKKLFVAIGLLIVVLVGIWYRYSVRISSKNGTGGYTLSMGSGRWLFATGVMGMIVGSDQGVEVQMTIHPEMEDTGKCIKVARDLDPIYCIKEDKSKIDVYVNRGVFEEVDEQKRQMGINLLLGEIVYEQMGGNKDRYWGIVNELQPTMWKVEKE